MLTDPRSYFVFLMASLEEALADVSVEWLDDIRSQVKANLPATPEDMPYAIDQHPNDFKIMHKNVEFIGQVVNLAKLAQEIRELKKPSIALKISINSKASQQ